ncbi:MAG: methionine--tRNA ligase subunit beta, partial [Bacteroidales bacterium]|nr:methionine--tRNA ligase subunit beta [Bacteroidales bacterium]
DFQARNNSELVAILGNFVNRTLVLTGNYYEGRVPQRGDTDENDNFVLSELSRIKTGVGDNLESFRFREALREAMSLARLGNKYLADSEPWKVIKSDPERVKTIINISLQISANLSIILEPFLPFSMKKLRGWLGIVRSGWDQAGDADLLAPGHTITKPSLLFDKIEDDQIERQISKLHATKRANEAAALKIPAEKEQVSFDDFMRLDLRTATILEAERVPKTDKLLRLKIDTGIDIRTIVSGIAEYFDPLTIIGKQISIVANLEPRRIKGIESKGMILMAEDHDGKLVMVTPSENVSNGSIIK